MEVIRIALTDRLVSGGFSLAGVGYLRPGDRGAIPQAADFLLTEENVHTAICYGILVGGGEGEAVIGRGRAGKATVDVGRIFRPAHGRAARGTSQGGGRG